MFQYHSCVASSKITWSDLIGAVTPGCNKTTPDPFLFLKGLAHQTICIYYNIGVGTMGAGAPFLFYYAELHIFNPYL